MAGKKQQAPAKFEEPDEAEGWEEGEVNPNDKDAAADLRLRDWRDVERYREIKELRKLVDEDEYAQLEALFPKPVRTLDPRGGARPRAAKAKPAAAKPAAATSAKATAPVKGATPAKATPVVPAKAAKPAASAKAAPAPAKPAAKGLLAKVVAKLTKPSPKPSAKKAAKPAAKKAAPKAKPAKPKKKR